MMREQRMSLPARETLGAFHRVGREKEIGTGHNYRERQSAAYLLTAGCEREHQFPRLTNSNS
jgi:hypothetical protein